MIMEKKYEHIIPQIRNWPIYKASRKKREFKQELKEEAFKVLKEKNQEDLKDLLAQCAYVEKKRVLRGAYKVDPASEKGFWLGISKQITSGQDCDIEENCDQLLQRIVGRYAEEIVGGFKMETFLFADKFLTYFFNRLYSSWFAGSMLNFFGKKKLLRNKLRIEGYLEHTRELFKHGTVVLVPTHQSNLDSILIGYIMQLNAGLPAFSYGAGLNLYNFEILGYYMNRLGAYKVDRRKRNAIYHETLFTFLRLSVQDGVNNLFFPAGGRVRDGKIEQHLKMGLLSALIQAQKSFCLKGKGDKVFIVPVVLNYHFVLEAKALINEYLAKRGREKFNRKRKPKSYNYRAFIPYLMGLVRGDSEVVLSFGKPMDVIGNLVDEMGNSFDKHASKIDLEDYFKTDGNIVSDYQRESVYTKNLAKSIAKSYQDHAVILSSHLVAYVCYQYLKTEKEAEDIFALLAFNEKDLNFDTEKILGMIDKLKQSIILEAQSRNWYVDDDLFLDANALLEKGIKRLGKFHLVRPLKLNSDQRIVCKDLKLLYYYANRLRGFGFEEIVNK